MTALSSGIESQRLDPELRAEMSVRGRAFVEERYSVRALQEPFAQALLDAAGRRP